MNISLPAEARRERRVHVEVKATVSIDGRELGARTRDVSMSGLCLISTEEIPRDSTMQIALVLSFGKDSYTEPLKLPGRAIWCTKLFGQFQVGAMFVDIDDEQYRYLSLFMRFMDGELDADQSYHEPPTERMEDKDDPFRP